MKSKKNAVKKSKSRSPGKAPSKVKATAKVKKNRMVKTLGNWADKFKDIFKTQPKDTTGAVKMDHDGLRNFLSALKDTDRDMTERRRAYTLFASLLKSHTIAEETVVYKTADKLMGRELHIKIAEGYVEHKLAEDLMKRIEACTDPMEWSAHANVLSEIVEHHLKEEERDLLPLIKKSVSAKDDADMLINYLAARAETQTKLTEKNSGSLELLK